MKRKLAVGLPLFLLFVLQLVSIIPVRACSGNFRETTLQEHVDDADLIFVGTVIGSTSDNPYEANYTVQVENYLKGQNAETVLMTGFGSGGGDCLNAVAVGERWLFFADTQSNGSWIYTEHGPQPDGILYASYLQVYDSLMDASEENIAAVSAITGQAPTPGYSVQIGTLIKYWTYSPVFRVAVLAGIPLVVITGALAFGIARKRGRKSKKKNQQGNRIKFLRGS